MERIPSLPRFLVLVILSCLALFSLLRVGFWLYFSSAGDPVPAGELLTAFYLGLKFDLRFTLVLLLPLFLLGGLPWLDPFRYRAAKVLWVVYLTLAGAATLLFYVIDFGHYSYVETRVDASALGFLRNLGISLQMVWESYPVVWLSLLGVVGVCLIAYLLHRLIVYCSRTAPEPLNWKGRAMVHVTMTLLLLGGLYGKLSYYPLRWSDAYFSERVFVSQIAQNPVLYFTDTVRNGGGAVYDEDAVRANYREMAEWLGVDRPDEATLDFHRAGVPVRTLERPPNVVIVLMESMAAHKTGLSGNALNPTPHLDALAGDGYYFKNFFTPVASTARSVFCTVTGIPDVETHGTSSRNPRVVEQHTIMNCFSDYEKFYFLGGSISWGNIRGLLMHNIPGLQVHEEGCYNAPRVDVWGISDLSLFREADQVFRKQTKPFLAVIQTAGNHRPYTIPDDNAGFEQKYLDDEVLRKSGFICSEHFNACRFMDHSVGQFIKLAEEGGYIDNTIFVFFADHGISNFPGEHVSKTDLQGKLGCFRVPLIIYSPKLIPKGEVFTKVASEVDVLPTIASLAGRRYTNTTMGRDLLDPRFDSKRYAFTMRVNGRPKIGLVSDQFCFEMGVDGSSQQLRSFERDDAGENLIDRKPEVAAEMERFIRVYLESAKYMLYHNGPKREPRIHTARRKEREAASLR